MEGLLELLKICFNIGGLVGNVDKLTKSVKEFVSTAKK